MFNTTEAPKRESRLVELAKNDLANAKDNLYRARMAAQGRDVNAQWGQSGQTLAQIIAGYEGWAAQAMETLEQARRLTHEPPRR